MEKDKLRETKKDGRYGLGLMIAIGIAIVVLLAGIFLMVSKKDKIQNKELEKEKYLLEKRLDLKKYFVFNLGELEGSYVIENSLGREIKPYSGAWKLNPLLSEHLTTLTHEQKDFVCFVKNQKAWSEKNLTQKIADCETIYIVIDKNIIWEHSNYFAGFSKFSWFDSALGWKTYANGINVNTSIINLMGENYISVFPSKNETLEFLKNNDPFFNQSLQQENTENNSPIIFGDDSSSTSNSPKFTPLALPKVIDFNTVPFTPDEYINEKVEWNGSYQNYYLFTTFEKKGWDYFYIAQNHPFLRGKNLEVFSEDPANHFTLAFKKSNASKTPETRFENFFFNEDNNNFALTPSTDWPDKLSEEGIIQKKEVRVYFSSAGDEYFRESSVCFYDYNKRKSKKWGNCYKINSQHPAIINLQQAGKIEEWQLKRKNQQRIPNLILRYGLVNEVSQGGVFFEFFENNQDLELLELIEEEIWNEI